MSEHRARIDWISTEAPFTYDTYSRAHSVAFPSGQTIETSAAPEYQGDGARTNPEEMLVAAASSCHMLTFLAIAARKRIVVKRYTDDAVGYLAANEDKVVAVTRIELRPTIVFDGAPPSEADLTRLHELAHKNCFIANSIRASVTVV